MKEYFRVLKPNGILGIAPIYYKTSPPESLLGKIEEYIGTKIDIKTLDEWKKLIIDSAISLNTPIIECYSKRFRYHDQSNKIPDWIFNVSNKSHLNNLNPNIKSELLARYADCIESFNENLKFCEFSLLIYQKRNIYEEPELFFTEEVNV